MNKILPGCALIALALTSCNKKPEAEAVAAPTPAPAPVAMQTPAFSPFAPSGVFFLVSRYSVETDAGVLHYPAGTKLYKLNNRYVTADGKQLTLRVDQVTNDLRIATQVAGRDPKLQAAIQATIRTMQANSYATPEPTSALRLASEARPATKPGTGTPAPRPVLDGDGRKLDKSHKLRQ